MLTPAVVLKVVHFSLRFMAMAEFGCDQFGTKTLLELFPGSLQVRPHMYLSRAHKNRIAMSLNRDSVVFVFITQAIAQKSPYWK